MSMHLFYKNRLEAARVLTASLTPYAGRVNVLVLGLPRGGVPVACEIAKVLQAPMDLMLVRKLGVPGHRELAMGAIAMGGVRVLNTDVIEAVGISEQEIERVVADEEQELRRRERVYRGDRPLPEIAGWCVILVDDGLATGATMRAAVSAVRQQNPAQIVVAVPVAPSSTIAILRQEADEVICPAMPQAFFGISQWYEDFTQVTDDEVRGLLEQAWGKPTEASKVEAAPAPGRHAGSGKRSEVTVRTQEVALQGNWLCPEGATAIVVFAHGSGSSRHSPRNQFVAQTLNDAGLATLLFDLLTPDEERIDLQTRALRFDIALLANRLIGAVDWLQRQPETQALQIGLFGASTGAAAALIAAAHRPAVVGAVVSRGGRPDLANHALPQVTAPTLLIVGGEDAPVIALNRAASRRLQVENRLAIVPGATHLFEEPGALEEVARLARDWFRSHLLSKGLGKEAG